MSTAAFTSIADREAGGLCCPVELSGLLKSAFAKMDEELLKWLKGAFFPSLWTALMKLPHLRACTQSLDNSRKLELQFSAH